MNDFQNRNGGSDLPRPRKKQESYVPPSVPQYPRNFSEPPTTAFPAPQPRHEDYGSDTEEYTIPFSAYTEEEYSSVYDEDDISTDFYDDIPETSQPIPSPDHSNCLPDKAPAQPQPRPQQPPAETPTTQTPSNPNKGPHKLNNNIPSHGEHLMTISPTAPTSET